MRQDYTYAVARIRFKETRLLSDADLDALLASKDTEAALRLLHDKGWGDNADSSVERMLSAEEKKLWDFVFETIDDRSVLNFLLAPNDFHNLKVAVKCITRDIEPDDLFVMNSIADPRKVYQAVKTREYGDLPDFLRDCAKEAMTALLQTSDGQLCDVIIDKACMDDVYRFGKDSENDMIRLYCELFVAAADIKIAVRCAKTHKKLDFIRRAIAVCDTLNAEKLSAAAADGYDAILSYLAATEYRSAIDAIGTSMSAFEKWCDDYMTAVLKPQKREPFGIGPIVAYIIARQNEIKAVRMILSGKANDLSAEMIKERLRSMYV